MRLTLRTMLAYLDDILEPEDADAIRKKIEESEFATNLLHRIRDVMRRLRLGTPDVSDRGLGLDPNTVAEYLDNSLAPDQVLDFEKICLESDVHLAEVACCHQILALVLGEPAEVDPASRQRMYQLPKLMSQAKAALETDDVGGAESAPESPRQAGEPAPEPAAAPRATSRPRWLRDQTRPPSWRRTAVVVALVAVSVILVLAMTGQLEPGSFLENLVGFRGAGEPVGRAPESTPVPNRWPGESGPNVGGPTEAESPEAGPTAAKTDGAEGPASDTLPTTPAAPGAELPKSRPEGPPATAPGGMVDQVDPSETAPEGKAPPEGQGEPAPPGESPPVEPRPQDLAGREPGVSATVPGVGMGVEPRREPAPLIPAGSTPPPLAQPPVAGVAETDQPGMQPADQPDAPPRTEPAPARAPLPSEVMGQFDSPLQVLLVYEADTGTWRRLQDLASLTAQASYLSLPTYRPMLHLVDQTQVWLIDGTRIELLPADQTGTAGLLVEHGRLVIDAPEKPGSRLRLQVGDRSGTIAFEAPGSRLAIEVFRASTSGADPETQPGALTANLYATSGSVSWQEGAGSGPVLVDAPVRLTLDDQPLEPATVGRFPDWIVGDTFSLLDQRASGTVERELEVGRSTVLGLRELADHRRREVRSLALRCLDCLGDFELLVAALDDPDQKMAWPDYVEQLRAAVVRSPLAAAQVRTAMERLHGSEGASLYEMLWKFGDNALDGQQATHLVGYLDHNTLAFRVVSFQTLRRVTKLGLNYRPEDTASKRRPWIQKWEERLQSSAALGGETQADPRPL
ncbi:MAG TPA: hypothetical protein VMY37_15410 [Thermoguttaceae bacterium]|nr:hypothetical protein [Thermoguttaceae bacterium]